jgi:hypothetical protein
LLNKERWEDREIGGWGGFFTPTPHYPISPILFALEETFFSDGIIGAQTNVS